MQVKVSWTVEQRTFPPDTPPAHHFRVGLALQEVDVPLDAVEHVFDNVEAGNMAGFITVCRVDGTEIAPPVTYSVDVAAPPPPPPDVVIPVPIAITAVVL
jgi:hypothetical protein